MTLRVELTSLYALAEKIEGLERDISALSETALGAANSVIERTTSTPYEPLKAACEKAMDSVRQAKSLTRKVSGDIDHQTETLRYAAESYERNDRL